jgi:hypothetical protein
MTRSRFSDEERKKIFALIDKRSDLEKRKGRLYNSIYRKSFIFIGSWVARILYFTLFIIVCIFNRSSGSITEEVLVNVNKEIYKTSARGGPRTKVKLYLETNNDSYSHTANISEYSVPDLYPNDTIEIERNIFGKAIYFSKPGWRVSYGVDFNFQFYYIILFVTFVSFFFNDGTDSFVSKLLWLTYAVDIVAMAVYFFT